MTRLSLDFFKTFLVVHLRAYSKRALRWSRASFMLENITVSPWIFEARAEVSSAGASFSSSHIILLLTFEARASQLKAEARAEVSSARAYYYFKLWGSSCSAELEPHYYFIIWRSSLIYDYYKICLFYLLRLELFSSSLIYYYWKGCLPYSLLL
jgi:hypothetical protein